MTTIHVCSRSAIMRRAWQIARQRREKLARQAFDLNTRIVGSRIISGKTYEACLAETPLDLGAAQKAAWAEAKRGSYREPQPSAGVIVWNRNALAPLRRFRAARIWPLLLTAARFVSRNFIRSRAA